MAGKGVAIRPGLRALFPELVASSAYRREERGEEWEGERDTERGRAEGSDGAWGGGM